jgi:hypothetical protein
MLTLYLLESVMMVLDCLLLGYVLATSAADCRCAHNSGDRNGDHWHLWSIFEAAEIRAISGALC